MRARLSTFVSFLAALLLALNVVCLCPHAAERRAEAAAAGHCGGAHPVRSAPAPDDSRCPHCDEVGARLAQSGAELGLGTPPPALDLAIAPALAALRIAAPERTPRRSAPRGGVAPPSPALRTIVLQI